MRKMEPKVEEEMKRGEWSTRRDGRGMDSRQLLLSLFIQYEGRCSYYDEHTEHPATTVLILSDQHDHECMKMM